MNPKRFPFYANTLSLIALERVLKHEAQDFEIQVIEAPRLEADFKFFCDLAKNRKFKKLDLSCIKENVAVVSRILSEAKFDGGVEVIGYAADEELTATGGKRKRDELSSATAPVKSQVIDPAVDEKSTASKAKRKRIELGSVSSELSTQAKPEAMAASLAVPREKLIIIPNMRFSEGEFSRSIRITSPTVISISSLVRAEDEPLLTTVLKNPAWSKFIVRIDCSHIKLRPSDIDPEPIYGRTKMTHDEWITDCILKFRAKTTSSADRADYLKVLQDYFSESQARAKELVDEAVARVMRCCGPRAPKILMPTGKPVPICVLTNGFEVDIQWIGTLYDRRGKCSTFFPAPTHEVKAAAAAASSEACAGAGCASSSSSVRLS